MPQNTLRSVVYRSIVSCEDPNGVVECGTIRKFKSGSQKMERRQTQKDHQRVFNPSFVCKEERNEQISQEISRELNLPIHSQLLEVSRGAQKINHMIESWSKGLSFDGESKDIAEDLLKGALDLQDSLIMLGHLQKASKYISQSKKQKQKFERGQDEVGVERPGSDQLELKNNQMGLQHPQDSADGSWRNCNEELKKLIRDSLSRQNLLPTHSTEVNNYWGGKKLDSDLDIPSTSSSQSTQSSKLPGSVNSSISSVTQERKAKALVAKHIGLEELSSEQILISKIEMEGNNNLYQPTPIYDVEMPKQRKPWFVDSNLDLKQKTLQDIIETMHFKGLLKRKHVDRHMFQSHLPDTSCAKQRMDDEIPPIVIIKPRSSCVETEGPFLGKFIFEEKALDPNNRLKLKGQKVPPTKMSIGEERGLELNQKERPGKMKREEVAATRMLFRDEGASERKEILRKLKPKKEPQSKRFIKEEGAQNSREKIRDPEAKELETKGKASSYKMKFSIPLNNKPQKKKDNKKAEKMEKVLSGGRKPQGNVNVKFVAVPRSHEHAKATSSKLQKPDKTFTIVKNRLSHQESTTQNPKAIRSAKSVSQDSSDQLKKERAKMAKPIRGSLPLNEVIENSQCKHEDKKTNMTCEMDSTSNTTNSWLGDQHSTAEGTGISESEDYCEDWKTIHCEISPQASQHENRIESAQEAKQLFSHKTAEKKTVGTEVGLRLLLSSPSFLRCVEEFFNFNVNNPVALEKAGIEEVGMINSRLFMDFANELLERKRLISASHVVLPLVWISDPQINVSLDHLVDIVCDGVENLTSYSNGGDDVLPMDSLYVMSERDLSGDGVVLTSVWDVGWKNGSSMDEAGNVVYEVEKQLFDGLIEEFMIDILY
ncbi:hypothetical protein NE237_030282 [Protea cynaroides]|uniref:DUF4378 domain-containing protein n=1 Tax=Protea cynaroides TaxID=273540 RepID=A0A9Q0JWU6_9MAGN|nr:hypothetical protein NE237_030282 [Protea cynaroides]